MEVGVAILFHMRIVGAGMRIAGRLHGGMKIDRVFKALIALVGEQGIEVAAAAKPGFAGHQHARVHVGRGHARVEGVSDQGNSAGPELTAGFVCAGYLGSKGFGKSAVDFREMHANLFEHLAPHQAHAATAQVCAAIAPAPVLQHESPGISTVKRGQGSVFDGFEARDDVFLKRPEPGACLGLARREIGSLSVADHALLLRFRSLPRKSPVVTGAERR